MRRGAATLIGGGAILLWATLAWLTAASGRVPPVLLTALTFGIAFAVALATWLVRGENPLARLRLPWRAWAVGVGGLFGFHALYFLALRLAPPVEASLICYLWPLLIVLLSGLLPGERLRLPHILGAVLGAVGAGLVIARGGLRPDAAFVPGYAAALAAAFVWAGYSLLSRRLPEIPSDAVGGFCGVTALGAAIVHLLVETPHWPAGGEWLAVIALGLGPVGIAFLLWDIGVKRGDIRALGAAAYAAPLLSTVLLMATGTAAFSWNVLVAALLVTAGGLLAAGDLRRHESVAPTE
jgi:drug/metabolite transporter (DMT)-like permease